MTGGSGVRGALLLGTLGALAGCDFISDPGDGANGFAPRIDRSFPDAAVLELISEPLLFSAEGADEDSLDLSWSWQIDDEEQAIGDSSDGRFDADWTMAHDPAWSGSTVDVRFEVSDGALNALLIWAVDVR